VRSKIGCASKRAPVKRVRRRSVASARQASTTPPIGTAASATSAASTAAASAASAAATPSATSTSPAAPTAAAADQLDLRLGAVLLVEDVERRQTDVRDLLLVEQNLVPRSNLSRRSVGRRNYRCSGWQKVLADTDVMGTYQLFSDGAEIAGGMFTKPVTVPAPFWLYYFNISDVDEAANRVTERGGQVINGPIEVPDGCWIFQCTDPQGAIFGLVGKRRHKRVIIASSGRTW
jgi:predicted enzyme related to lactoylglutathione lyase